MTRSSFRRFGSALLFSTVAALAPLQAAEVVVTESAGTISSFDPDALVIRSEVATAPTRYVVSKDITYVDETGAPISREVVQAGAPVTIQYVREADRVVARRVVVRRRPATAVVETTRPAVVEERVVRPAAPAVVEERAVIRETPKVIERRTTTTTTTTTAPAARD